jgi:hypothetical protein
VADRPNAADPEYSALNRSDAVGAEGAAENYGWHPHGDDRAHRPSLQKTLHLLAGLAQRKAVAEGLLEKALQFRRKAAEPQRINQDQMIGPQNGLLRFLDDL